MTSAGICLGQQPLNDPFRHLVFTFAEVMVTDPSLRIDDIEGGPDRIVAIDRDRITDPHVLGCAADVVDVLFKWELGGVHTDHDQPLVLVLFGPGANIGKCAKPVDAGVGPDVYENDMAAQAARRQWLRVEPSGRAGERWQVTFDGQLCRSAHVLSGGTSHAEPGDGKEHRRSAQGAAEFMTSFVGHRAHPSTSCWPPSMS